MDGRRNQRPASVRRSRAVATESMSSYLKRASFRTLPWPVRDQGGAALDTDVERVQLTRGAPPACPSDGPHMPHPSDGPERRRGPSLLVLDLSQQDAGRVCRRLRAGLSRDLVPGTRVVPDPPSRCVLCTFAARGRELSVRVSASAPAPGCGWSGPGGGRAEAARVSRRRVCGTRIVLPQPGRGASCPQGGACAEPGWSC